jgi:hypothetical protein
MKKYITLGLKVLLAILILLQFVRPAKNESNDMTNDISKAFPVPEAVQSALKTSCYDCHSNLTKYPWYANIQPVGLWLADHVKEGKREVNFNEFSSYNPRRQYKKFDEIMEQIKEGEMPLSSYTLIHKDAVLTDQQKTLITNWAQAMRDTMQAHYPLDSLKMKRREGPPRK